MQEPYKKSEPFEGKAFPLHVFTASNGSELIQPHWHEHMEFIQVCSGTPVVSVAGSTFQAQEGELFFVNSGVVHSAYVNPGQAASTHALVFDRFFVTNVTEGFDTRHLYSLFTGSAAVEVRFSPGHPLWSDLSSCFQGILTEMASRSIGYEMLVKSYVYRMMGLLLRYNGDRLSGWKTHIRLARELDALKPVLTHIDTHYKACITTRSMSSLVNMSEYHFCRFFKRVTGQTLTEYVNQVRINMAVKLLLDSTLTVQEVCEAAGFANASYFNRVFRKIKGTSPVKFRTSYCFHQPEGQ